MSAKMSEADHNPDFFVGQRIRLTIGKLKDFPFKDFRGVVSSVDWWNRRLTAKVAIFGRETPLELSFDNVEDDPFGDLKEFQP